MLAGVSPLAAGAATVGWTAAVMSEGGRVLVKELVVAADGVTALSMHRADAADGVFTGRDSLSSCSPASAADMG